MAGETSTARIVGRYEVLRELGRGGMAVVHLASQTDLQRHVALKELSRFHAGSAEFAHRFLRESRLAGSLNHPNIVTVYEYFEYETIPYIAMEYVPRGSLRSYAKRMTLAQMAGALEGVLAGLTHAEQAGIVHRDMKPENLMVTADGRVKIADFGIARATQRAGTRFMTATGMTVGTPTYMAPEQAMAGDIGPWTDLYSVGVIAYELVVGHVPFHDTDAPMVILMRHVNEQIPPASSVRPGVDPALSDWIERLLAKDPKERPQSASEAWEQLEELIVNQLGPLWRRGARLLDDQRAAEGSRPLTPAPFESQGKLPTPAPTPVAPGPDSGIFKSVAGEGLMPATPAEVEALQTPSEVTPAEMSSAVTPAETPSAVIPAAETPSAVTPVETPPAVTPPETPAAETPAAVAPVETPPAVTPPETPAAETPAAVAPVETPPAVTTPDTPPAVTPAAEAPAAAQSQPSVERTELDDAAAAGAAGVSEPSGFVTFDPGRGGLRQPPPVTPAPTPEPPIPTPETPVATPQPPVATPEPPIETPEPRASLPDSAVIPAALAADQTLAPAWAAQPDAATAEPEEAGAEPEAEPEAAVAEEALAEPEAAVAEPEKAVAEPEAAVVESEGAVAEPEEAVAEPEEAVAEPEAAVVEPELLPPEPPPPSEPPSEAAEPGPDEPSRSRSDDLVHRRNKRRGAVAVAAVAAVAAAAVGFVVAPSSNKSVTTTVPLSQTATAGALRVSYPSGWSKTSTTPSSAKSLHLTNGVALAADKSAPGGALVVGTGSSQTQSLLPSGFVHATRNLPHPSYVKLGGTVFERYLNVIPKGAGQPESVYVMPTSKGIATAVCVDPQSGAPQFAATCERAVATLKTRASRLSFGADPNYARALSAVISKLDRERTSLGAKLSSASTPAAQAAAAQRLAHVYRAEAKQAGRLNPGPVASAANAAILAALARLAAAYSGLATAASKHDGAAYRAAQGRVKAGESALSHALAQLRQAGYNVG